MKKSVCIPVGLYHTQVIVTYSKKDFLKYSKKIGHSKHDFNLEVAGLCLNAQPECILVGVFEDAELTLLHELVHACVYILKRCGLDPYDSDGEAMAFLYEYLYSKTKQSRKKKK